MANKSILIVEDEKKIADVLNDYCSKSDYCVFRLDPGDRVALQEKHGPPHPLPLDITPSNIPVLIVTTCMEEAYRILGLAPGSDDYIRKPFHSRNVGTQTETVLRRVNTKSLESKLTAGPISLDEVAHRVMVEDQALDLTPSEFSLLKIMMTYPNRVFSRTELLDKALGYQHDGYDRSIDTHIKNLRKKLSAKLPDKEFIHAVYGIGYRFSLQAKKS